MGKELEKINTDLAAKDAEVQEYLRSLPGVLGERSDEQKTKLAKLMDEHKALSEKREAIRTAEHQEAEFRARSAEFNAQKPGQTPGAEITRGVGTGIEVADKRVYNGPFALGCQLADIAAERGLGFGAKGRKSQEEAKRRLEKSENRRVHLMTEMHRTAGTPTYSIGNYESGGIFLETEVGLDLMTNGFNNSEFLSRCDRRTMTGPYDRMDIISRAEQSRADSATAPDVARNGGTRWYWEAELDELTFSQMKWEKATVEVRKIMSGYNASEEILQDVGMLTGEVNSVVSEEFAFKMQLEAIDGNGAPSGFLGIFNAPCKIPVAKKSAQTADTIVWENIRDMKYRQKRFGNSVWLINQFAQAQLEGMYVPTGSTGELIAQVIYKEATSENGFATLYGRPVIPIEQCRALGDLGDIYNVDPSRYVVVDKGGMDMASSIHVFFLHDQRTFRFKARIGGMPKDKSSLLPYYGSTTVSSIVTLAERA